MPQLGGLLLEIGELDRAAAVLDEAVATGSAQGEEWVAAVAAAWRSMLAGHVGEPSGSFERTIALAEEAARLLEQAGDDAAAAAMLGIEAQHRFFSGRARDAEAVFERAVATAFRSGDLAEARECFVWSFGAKTYGAAPVSEITEALENIPELLASTIELTPLHAIPQCARECVPGPLRRGEGPVRGGPPARRGARPARPRRRHVDVRG